MTTLYLIRHGATEANLRRPYWLQGQGRDEPLAALGLRQAERVRDLLAPLQIAAFCSSPLQRARRTAEVVADGRPLEIVPTLQEGDVGRWEGRTYEEIERNDAAAFRAFQEDPARHGYPEGETFAQILERVLPALADLAARHEGQAVAVVTHQIVCRVYLGHLLGLPAANIRKLKTANGGISVVAYDQGQATAQTVNATFHLEGVMTPP